MKKYFLFLFVLVSQIVTAQVKNPDVFFNSIVGNKTNLQSATKLLEPDISIDLKDAPLAQLISLMFFEMQEENYFLHPEVLDDQRKVSLRWRGKAKQLRFFLEPWLFGLGFDLSVKNNFMTIRKIIEEKKEKIEDPLITFIYEPKFNSSANLQTVVQGIIGRAAVSAARSVPIPQSSGFTNTSNFNVEPPKDSAASFVDRDEKFLILRCTEKEKILIEDVLKIVDVPQAVVSLSGVVYEVSLTKNDSSALSIFGAILKNKIGISFNHGSAAADNTLRFSIGGLDTIFSALDSDSRFKVVSNPSIAVRSGASARLTVGEDVPTAGAVTQSANGQSIQSIEYKSSGVILDFKPQVFRDVIRVNFQQTISSFVKTETGINNSPTLIKREAKSDIDLTDGEVFVLGGLTDSKESNGRSSFPVPWLSSFAAKNSNSRNTELLIILKVQKVKRDPA